MSLSKLRFSTRVTFAAFLVLVAAVALAQAVPPPDPGADPAGFLGLVLAAIQGKQWIVLAGLVVVAIVYVARTYGSRWWPWLATDRGGAALSLAVGILSSVALTLLAGTWSWAAILNGVLLAFFSSGGYAILKKLISPSDPAAKPAA